MSTPSPMKTSQPDADPLLKRWHRRLQRAPGGGWAVATLGLGWSLFFVTLSRDGHAPSGPLLLPVPRAEYYRFEAIAFLPWLLACWLVAAATGHFFGRKLGGRGEWRGTAHATGWSLTASMGGLWLLPDWTVYLLQGFAALKGAMRIYAPLASLLMLFLLTASAAAEHQLNWKRAGATGIASFIAYTLFVSLLLR